MWAAQHCSRLFSSTGGVFCCVGWETLDQKRNYTKSILMYKKIDDHAAPNLKQSFRLYSEGDTMRNLRNLATDEAKNANSIGIATF